MLDRKEIIQKIITERERQLDIPGLEWDVSNSPNDWIAIAASYCTQAASRKGLVQDSDDFEFYMTKAAAVIVAALEHIPVMIETKKLYNGNNTHADK